MNIFYEVRKYTGDMGHYKSKYFQSFDKAKCFCKNKITEWFEEGAFVSYYNGQNICEPLENIIKQWEDDNYSIYDWIEIIKCQTED